MEPFIGESVLDLKDISSEDRAMAIKEEQKKASSDPNENQKSERIGKDEGHMLLWHGC